MQNDDCTKAITMLDKMQIQKLGIISNMDGYECTHCQQHNSIFTEDIKAWAKQYNIPHLGSIPLHQDMATSASTGIPIMCNNQHTLQKNFQRIAISLAAQLSQQPLAQKSKFPKIVVEKTT